MFDGVPEIAGDEVPAKVSTEALKRFIASMHNEGFTDAQIASRFGYHRSYINSLRGKMGLEAKWGKSAPRFTVEMDADILRLHDEDELRWAEIGRIVNRPGREVAERYNFLDQRRTEEAEKGPVVIHTKKCLRCRNPFETMDRKKEWYCGSCRDDVSGYGNTMDYVGSSAAKSATAE